MTPAVLSPPEAAEILGLSANTVRRLVREGELTDAFADWPINRVGIPVAEIEARIGRPLELAS